MKHPCNDYAFFHVLISFNTKQILLESFLWDSKHQKWREIPGVRYTACFSGSISAQNIKIPQVSQHSKKKKKKKLNKIKKEVIYAGENVIFIYFFLFFKILFYF